MIAGQGSGQECMHRTDQLNERVEEPGATCPLAGTDDF
jgi:hypothetical protein